MKVDPFVTLTWLGMSLKSWMGMSHGRMVQVLVSILIFSYKLMVKEQEALIMDLKWQLETQEIHSMETT